MVTARTILAEVKRKPYPWVSPCIGMEQNTTSTEQNSTLTETDLRDAGASATYIAYYKAAQESGESTASTRHAEKVVNRGVSYSGGGFHDSLWNAEPRYPNNSDNPFGADSQNSRLLDDAGVYPYAEA